MQNWFGKNNKKSHHGPIKKPMKMSTTIFVILFVKKLKKSHKKSKYRSHILNQWLTTQYSYCRDLKSTVTLIKNPMINQFKIISESQGSQLFPELQNMINLSDMMISVLEKAKTKINPNQILIGKQLNSFAYGYKVYGTYFGVHSKKQRMLNDLAEMHERKMKDLEQNLQKQMKKKDISKQSITIKDCMQQPLYRLFKYVLFMKDYIKRLPPIHPDYQAVNQAMKTFHDINNSNNELMKVVEEQQKKTKLNQFYGGVLKNTRNFIAEMQADTIYSTGKIYLFNDLVIVTKLTSSFGSEKEERLQIIQLDQFSYIEEQPDMKYLRNILVLIGKEQCVHLIFVEEGSRFEVYKSLNKILKQLRVRSQERRKVEAIQKDRNQHKKKITFTLKSNQGEQLCFRPQFRVEIIGFQVRPISAISNDTVYVTRFMMPIYYQDQLLQDQIRLTKSKGGKNFKVHKMNSLPFSGDKYNEEEQFQEAGIKRYPHRCINQRVQIHFSQLQNIYNSMLSRAPGKLPDIDPITKQVNIYSKGKKKTKSFEMRKFFIQQFFNYVFRDQNLLGNPLWFIQKLRINPVFWEYSTERNQSIRYPDKKKSYGPDHCRSCEKSIIKSIQEFQHYRSFFLGKGNHLANQDHDRYCFNFYNILRARLLEFSYICFNTLQRTLLYYHYSQGRLDYPFIPHQDNNSTKKTLRVHLASLNDEVITAQFTETSTVGEIIDELGMSFGMKICFDYDLLVVFNGKRRVLDRDQYIIDVVDMLNLKCQQIKQNVETGKGIIGAIKKWGHDVFSSQDSETNRVYFYKTVYLHKSLELKSLQNKQRRKLELERIFWSVKEQLIKLSDQQFIEMAALYYTLQESEDLKNVKHLNAQKLNKKLLYKIVPESKFYSFENYAEMKRQIGLVIERQKQIILKSKSPNVYLENRILNQIWNNKDYNTYYILVQTKVIPSSVCKVMPNICLLGVNYEHIVITKSEKDTAPIVNLNLLDITFFTSVFSIFINHHQFGQFRFDSKIIYHFGEIVKKQQTIAKRFPQHRA